MPFQLNITFAGMCLLVHDKGSSRLQVLLPPTGHDHGGPPVPVHLARLLYEASQEQANGAPIGRLKALEMEGRALDLTNLPASAEFCPDLPPAVTRLSEATPRPVSRTLFGNAPGGRLLARVTLDRGEESWHHPGVRWHLGSGPAEPRAIAVTWTIEDVRADSLELRLAPLSGGASGETVELYPKENGKLDLYLFHAPENEIPQSLPIRYLDGPAPQPGERAEHFAAFYRLLEGPVGDPPVPVYPTAGVKDARAEAMPASVLGSLHTCVTATAEV